MPNIKDLKELYFLSFDCKYNSAILELLSTIIGKSFNECVIYTSVKKFEDYPNYRTKTRLRYIRCNNFNCIKVVVDITNSSPYPYTNFSLIININKNYLYIRDFYYLCYVHKPKRLYIIRNYIKDDGYSQDSDLLRKSDKDIIDSRTGDNNFVNIRGNDVFNNSGSYNEYIKKLKDMFLITNL